MAQRGHRRSPTTGMSGTASGTGEERRAAGGCVCRGRDRWTVGSSEFPAARVLLSRTRLERAVKSGGVVR